DYEAKASYDIVITATQGVTSTDQAVTVSVTDVNEAPVAFDRAASVVEDASTSGVLAAVDPDLDELLTYTLDAPVAGLTLGSDGGWSFDAGNAAYQLLKAGTMQDVVAYYTVKDQNGATSTAKLTITVTGANDAPNTLSIDGTQLAEYAAAGTVIGQLSGSDPDGDVLSYSLLDDAGGRFAIVDGKLVAGATLTDYEQAEQHSITIRVSDGQGGHFDRTILVSILNIDPETVIGTAAAETIVGGAGNDVIKGLGGADIIDGGAGIDTADYSDKLQSVVVTLRGALDATVSVGGIAEDVLRNVENLIGGGGDDQLTGDNGANVLNGGAGADILTGGLGDDIYYVDNAGDKVVEANGQGNDLIYSSVSYGLTGRNVETLVLTGNGNINATGNSNANRLIGNSGNNVLNGGTGADHLEGGQGNDVYIVDAAGDVVVELAGQGIDEVRTDLAAYILAANVENLTGTALIGQALTGNALANAIIGGAASDVLNGGEGADTLTGGRGDDIYYVDNVGDKVVEASGQGNDLIYSSVSYGLAGRYVETLVLTGADNINATGNSQANTLIGNSGNNVLNGGTGADHMEGGQGDDVYLVDVVGDVVVELSGQGIDEVRTGLASYTLGSNIENLTGTATTAQTLTGNDLDNVITGGSGNDTLNGGIGADTLIGGAGADTMAGGAGDDTYYVDNAGDKVVDVEGQGFDRIFSSVSYGLTGRLIEQLTLTGTANINATGNTKANELIGNSGANILDGGLAADILTGGAGADQFRFSTALGAGNVDTITDFSVADDTVLLASAIFAAAGPAGVLQADAFVIGAAAGDASDRIIYNSATGMLFYDADGSGSGAAVAFATIGTGLALTNADFILG
ncbi:MULTISPECIES: Ig-like domain-containing protein, partial [unclassified Sphingobium]|uniref:Ig-like domain-containing protein n=1 Tax=unclassified Sphingobium TaxID=2611147 RepID=UPI0035A70251